MHKNLTATVHLGTTRLTAIKDAMVARTGTASTVVLEPVIHERVFDPVTKIVGPAQEVMQLIGELAAHGEDCLQSCTRTAATAAEKPIKRAARPRATGRGRDMGGLDDTFYPIPGFSSAGEY